MQNKIVFITLPWWDVEDIPLAPAILKGILDSKNIKSATIDFNLNLFSIANRDIDLYEKYKMYFLFNDLTYIDDINLFYTGIIDKLDAINCDTVAISVFSVWTHRAVLDLCNRIKSLNKKYRILLGGRGLSVKPHTSIKNDLTSVEQIITFADVIKKRKLADYFILGDAEDAIVDYAITGNTDGNVFNYANDKLDYPFSNFDDYRLDYYLNEFNNQQLPVISSKGCVRSCDFCDVAAQLGNFKSKTGARLAEEIIYLAEKYKIYNFRTADSIVNGNIRELKNTCEILKQYNYTHENKIKWSGNWIARPPNTCKPSFFDLLAASGCESLTIGAESGSNDVLKAMNKKTNVEGLYYELEQLQRVGIKASINNVVAHWSETADNFYEHLRMLIKLGQYMATGTVTKIFLGAGFSLLNDTPAVTGPGNLISTNGNFNYLWFSKVNPSLTLKARYSRLYMLYKTAEILKLKLLGEMHFIHALEELKNKKEISSFYSQFISLIKSTPRCKTITDVHYIENIIKDIIRQEYKTSKLKLILESESVNGLPELIIRYNNNIIIQRQLTDGIHELNFELPIDYTITNKLTLELTNKGPCDTIVDQLGNIVRDKKIVFKEFKIDNIKIMEEPYFRNCTKFFKSGELTTSEPGLWGNNQLMIEFNTPFWQHYLACMDKLVYNKFPAEQLNRLLAEFLQEIQNLEF